MNAFTRLVPLPLLAVAACADVEVPDGCHLHGDHLHCDDDNHGLVTTVVLNFTPTDGGDTLSFEWSDPNNDGNPVVDDIVLPDGEDHDHHHAATYDVTVEVWNDLEDPAEDVTPDILDQADLHQFFFTGTAVEGPATGTNDSAILTHAYADTDANGNPVGLENTFTTADLGTGELRVTLRHMPEEDGAPVKVAGLADEVAANGFGGIGGGNDIDVTFEVEVE